jgi:hypothetical protein
LDVLFQQQTTHIPSGDKEDGGGEQQIPGKGHGKHDDLLS